MMAVSERDRVGTVHMRYTIPVHGGVGERRLALELRIESTRKSRQRAISYRGHEPRVRSQRAWV